MKPLLLAFTLFGLATIAGAVAQPQTAPEGALTFWNVSIVDIEMGTIRSGMSVQISDGRVSSVEPTNGSRPTAPSVIDSTGRYMIPGLWDSHVHLTKLGIGALSAFLANGVTAVRDMGSDLSEVLQWRKEVDSRMRPGPLIKTSGQILESQANVERMKREGTVEPVDRLRVPVSTIEEARRAVARLAMAGADLIKVRTVEGPGILAAITDAAHSRGLKVAGHPIGPPRELIEVRMASIEHVLAFPALDLPPAERLELFEELRRAEIWMSTTTVNFEDSAFLQYESAVSRLNNDPLRAYVSSYLAADWAEQVEERNSPEADQIMESFVRAVPDMFRDLREMHAAGVRFLAGSDAAVVFMYPGFSLHGELESLVRHVGLSPIDALRAAIANPAEFFGLEDELGAVRVGYRADLVLLDANPLEDIQNTRRIAGVVRDGAWFDRNALDELLATAASDANNSTLF